MSKYRNRPKGDYIKEAKWQDLYRLTEQWQSNLEFQLYEIEFLERLIDNYFVKLLLHENLDELRELQRDLYEGKNQSEKIMNRINIHLRRILNILDGPSKLGGFAFRDEHEQLEDDVSEFIKNQRVVRFTVFKMSKEVLESEKPKFFWKYN